MYRDFRPRTAKHFSLNVSIRLDISLIAAISIESKYTMFQERKMVASVFKSDRCGSAVGAVIIVELAWRYLDVWYNVCANISAESRYSAESTWGSPATTLAILRVSWQLFVYALLRTLCVLSENCRWLITSLYEVTVSSAVCWPRLLIIFLCILNI